MDQYIHDNTDDEISHFTFINAYLASKGAEPVNLDQFRTLPSSQADRRPANRTAHQPDAADRQHQLLDALPQRLAEPRLRRHPRRKPSQTLAVGQHTAIPRTNADTTDSNFLQAIANTAGFHFAWIEQGGTSLYASLAQRVNHTEVLRILLSIGGSEIMHFQTWQDKAGNAPSPLTAVDPVTGVSVTFPDLNADGEILQTNLIMPEPTIFLDRKFPIVLDHPPHRDRRRRHAARSTSLHRRRTVHRSTAGVLCSPKRARTGSGCGPTRRTPTTTTLPRKHPRPERIL